MRRYSLILAMLLLAHVSLAFTRPRPKRLTKDEVIQLANILFRVPEMQDVTIIRFRYVIAYSELSGDYSILVVLEPATKKEPRVLDVYGFIRRKCMEFSEENFGIVWYDNHGRPQADDIYMGGILANNSYDEGLRNVRSTPLFTFRRNQVRRSCATLDLLDDPALNDFRRREKEAEQARKKTKKK